MNANERIIFRIGQSIVDLEVAQDKIKDLTEKIKELEHQISQSSDTTNNSPPDT